ncbi:hypothetical protein AX16_008321 [Volvariella volvacea WC 439]|nr:hypothetical protein AX16_008321 [Volvariella volvacea WC 439]
MSASKLFQPIQVGPLSLQHRIVLAPLTRTRSSKTEHVPYLHLMKPYYVQRSRTPGTLAIGEATIIARKAGGWANSPGVWSDEQIKAWKEITDAVHANGSYMFCQIWAMGRAADDETLKEEDPSLGVVAPSPIPLAEANDGAAPRELTIPEIKEYTQLFAQAAKNAVEQAGFDGVEIHGANGYLVDQFLQDVTNKRTDKYGGSVENRSRFVLELIKAVSDAVGEERTAIRLSPWSKFQEMQMDDPVPQFTHVVTKLKENHPSLAYLHIIEPRVNGDDWRAKADIQFHESNDFIRAIWSPKIIISAGGHNRESAIKTAEEKGGLVAFGRYFISNPDLPEKIRAGVELTKYDRSTFYVPGEDANAAHGYIDYPVAIAPELHNGELKY